MSFEKSSFWAFIVIVLFFAYLSVTTVFDGIFLIMENAVDQDETGIGRELLGGFLEGFDSISFDIFPRD